MGNGDSRPALGAAVSADVWLQAHSGRQSRRQIAADLGINRETFNRAVNAGRLPADLCILFAHTYGMSACIVLEHFGWLTAGDLRAFAAQQSLRQASTQELLAELTRRAEE